MADGGDDDGGDDDDDEEVIFSDLLDFPSLLSLTLLMRKLLSLFNVETRRLFLEQFLCNLSLHECAVTMFGIRHQQIFLD